MLMLRITCRYEGRETVFESVAPEVCIGRPREGVPMDLDLTPDQSVSRPHARVRLDAGRYWIEDLGSRHGTQVNGQEIKGKGRRVLHDGHTVIIGDTTLRISILPADVRA